MTRRHENKVHGVVAILLLTALAYWGHQLWGENTQLRAESQRPAVRTAAGHFAKGLLDCTMDRPLPATVKHRESATRWSSDAVRCSGFDHAAYPEVSLEWVKQSADSGLVKTKAELPMGLRESHVQITCKGNQCRANEVFYRNGDLMLGAMLNGHQ